MKKLTALIIATFYIAFSSPLSALASELYYIQNADKNSVLSVIRSSFNNSGYTIKNNDPVYGVYGSKDAVAIVQPTGSDLYYYYDSASDKNLNSNIVKAVKARGLSCKKMRNETVSLSMEQTAIALKKSLSTEVKKYDFDSSEITLFDNTVKTGTSAQKYNSNKDDNSLTGYVAQIPIGTQIDIYLQSAVSTASAAKGDAVTAVLTKNWEYNGHVIAGQGSVVKGTVTKANSAGMAYKDGYVKFIFNQLQTVDGKTYDISTDPIEFKVDSTGKAADAAGKIIGRAAIGAIAGLIIGALSSDRNLGKATAIGAGAGAAWGAGAAVFEKGTDAEIPTYTELVLTLTAPLNVVISN